MQAKSFDKKVVFCGILAVLAAICGILESILPLQFIIPVPGVKLGIANIFVVFAFCFAGAKYAFLVSIARVLIVFAFSGNAYSLLMSVSGAVISFVSLYFVMKFQGIVFSYIGISAVSALFHCVGQIICAYFIVGQPIIWYAPVMLCCCTLTGVFTGTLMNVTYGTVNKMLSKFC